MSVFIKKYVSQESNPNSVTTVHKINNGIDLYSLVSISNTPDGYALTASKFLWEAISESYNSSVSSIDGIKKSIVAGSKKVLELMKNDKEIDEKGIDLNFAVIAIKDATAYLGLFGEQEIYVFKDGDVVNVSEVLNRNRVVAASFALEPSDCVVISSPGLFSSVIGKGKGEDLSSLLLESNDLLKSGQGILVLSRSKIDQDFTVIEDIEDIDRNVPSALPEEVINNQELNPESEKVDGERGISELRDTSDSIVEGETTLVGRGGKFLRQGLDKRKLEEYRVILMTNWGKVVNFFVRLWNSLYKGIGPVIDWLGRFVAKISASFWRFVDNKYGRLVWYKRLKSKLSAIRLTSGSSAYGMKIDGYKETSLRGKRAVTLILIILIVVVVLGGVRLSIRAKDARELHREATTVFESARTNLKQAEEYIHTDVSTSQGYIFQASEVLNKLKDKELSIDDKKVYESIKVNLSGLEDRIAKREWIAEGDGGLETYLSTRLDFGSNSNPTDITVYKDDYQNESLFVVDNGMKGVYRINLYDKSVVKIPDKRGLLKSPKFIDIGVNGVYVYDEVTGVVRSRFDTKLGNLDFEALTGLGADDLGVTDVMEFAIFAVTDNVYILSPSNQAILKSNFVGGGYTLPYTYISSAALSTAMDFFGDNVAIYSTGMGDAGVNRFVPASGDPLPISIVGPVPSATKITVGYTAATLDDPVYIFDGGDIKRILVLEKPKEGMGDLRHPNELVHLREYRYRGGKENTFSSVRDLVTDYQGKYLYILDGTVIHKLEIAK